MCVKTYYAEPYGLKVESGGRHLEENSFFLISRNDPEKVVL